MPALFSKNSILCPQSRHSYSNIGIAQSPFWDSFLCLCISTKLSIWPPGCSSGTLRYTSSYQLLLSLPNVLMLQALEFFAMNRPGPAVHTRFNRDMLPVIGPVPPQPQKIQNFFALFYSPGQIFLQNSSLSKACLLNAPRCGVIPLTIRPARSYNNAASGDTGRSRPPNCQPIPPAWRFSNAFFSLFRFFLPADW